MQPDYFDNRARIVKDDLVANIRQGDRLSVAASVFSMYAYRELKEQLEGLDEFRFIFMSDAFTASRPKKEKREFYIPRLSREQGLFGTQFEIRLRNELTQKAVAAGAILQAQYDAGKVGNACQLQLYYSVGGYVSANTRNGAWGTGAIEAISSQLQKELPGLRGFSATSIKYMRLFYEAWSPVMEPASVSSLASDETQADAAIAQIRHLQVTNLSEDFPVDEFFSIGFTHHRTILSNCKPFDERYFYIRRCVLEHYSRLSLQRTQRQGRPRCPSAGCAFQCVGKPDDLNLVLQGDTLDDVWDSIVSQVVFGDTGTPGKPTMRRIELVDKVASLERLVDDLDMKCRKAKQAGKKRQLFDQMRAVEDELEQARKELA